MRRFKSIRHLLVFSIVSNILLLVAPIHMTQVYDRVLSSGSGETLFYITMIGIGMLMVFGLSEMVRSKIAARLSAQYVLVNVDKVFQAISGGTVSIEDSQKVMRDFENVKQFVSSRVMVSLFDIPFAPIFLVLLYFLHVQLGVLTTIGVAILVGIAWLNKRSTAEDLEAVSKANMQAASFSQSIIHRSEDVRAMGLLPALIDRWGRLTADSLSAADLANGTNAQFYGISKSTRQILQISTMAWGAWLVLSGDMSGGMIFAATMISGRVLQPIEQLIGGWDNINRARQSHATISKILNELPEEVEKIRQPDPKGDLRVEGLQFVVGTNNDQQNVILNEINLEVEHGSLAAIIGPSGSGKSTLARCISGAMKPTSGKIYLDGCLQENWSAEQWGRFVGYVGQEVHLFPGSIAENIARMATSIDEEKVVRAAKISGCHDLINSFPEGYATQIGGGGVRLSGGQRQRIALARALYSNPKLLILDEPNANLDHLGEQILMETLIELRNSGATILVVTQRRSLLKIVDRILSVQEGELDEIDTKIFKAKQANKQPTQRRQSRTPQGPVRRSVTGATTEKAV